MKLFNINSYLPYACYKTIFDVDYVALYNSGKRLLLIDLDNTLIPYDVNEPKQEHLAYFNMLRKQGFLIVIISNNGGSRVERFAQAVNCPFVASAKKPLKWGYQKALRLVQWKNNQEIIAIGDQIVTDILGSSRMNIDCILVKPLKKRSEKWFTKINRAIERIIIKRIKRLKPHMYQSIQEIGAIDES